MDKRQSLFALISIFTLLTGAAPAQETAKRAKSTTVLEISQVAGSGTPGFISKWAGVFGTSTFTLGNSNIFEDKFGKVGIGTTTPTSPLTVQGMIETTMGGYKFPDGTIQTTAGISFVTHDASLAGLGTAASPLGIAVGGVQAIHLANGVVVRSLNSLTDNVQLAAGSNITITPAGNTLTIAAPNALTSVAHDSTLTGNGTPSSLLGVAAGGIGTTQLADNSVTHAKIAPNQVVTSLNNLKEDVTLAAGSNITITPSGNTLTIAGSDLSTVAYHAVRDDFLGLTAPGQIVISKQVPAGSYFISFRIGLRNGDNSHQTAACSLSTGDSALLRLDPGNSGDIFDPESEAHLGVLVLQDVATFQASTTITAHCVGFGITTGGSQGFSSGSRVLTALKVGSIQ